MSETVEGESERTVARRVLRCRPGRQPARSYGVSVEISGRFFAYDEHRAIRRKADLSGSWQGKAERSRRIGNRNERSISLNGETSDVRRGSLRVQHVKKIAECCHAVGKNATRRNFADEREPGRGNLKCGYIIGARIHGIKIPVVTRHSDAPL